jgi:peptidoglycan/LPS O-acetylase OafA/YrhL
MSDKSLHHRYIPGLDGLRAFAVLAVIAYHLNFNWACVRKFSLFCGWLWQISVQSSICSVN